MLTHQAVPATALPRVQAQPGLVWGIAAQHWVALGLVGACLLIGVGLDTALALMLKFLIDFALLPGDKRLLLTLLLILAVGFLVAACAAPGVGAGFVAAVAGPAATQSIAAQAIDLARRFLGLIMRIARPLAGLHTMRRSDALFVRGKLVEIAVGANRQLTRPLRVKRRSTRLSAGRPTSRVRSRTYTTESDEHSSV